MISQLVSPVYSVPDHKQGQGVIPGLPPNSYSVLAIAAARVYHAQLGKDVTWCYSRLRGTLIFGRDNDRLINASQATFEAGKHWFRLLDADSGKPVWMFKIPSGFVYELDRPFFHAFQGMVSLLSSTVFPCTD